MAIISTYLASGWLISGVKWITPALRIFWSGLCNLGYWMAVISTHLASGWLAYFCEANYCTFAWHYVIFCETQPETEIFLCVLATFQVTHWHASNETAWFWLHGTRLKESSISHSICTPGLGRKRPTFILRNLVLVWASLISEDEENPQRPRPRGTNIPYVRFPDGLFGCPELLCPKRHYHFKSVDSAYQHLLKQHRNDPMGGIS